MFEKVKEFVGEWGKRTYLGGLDFGAGSDNFTLTNTLGLSGHGEGLLKFVAEDDVFD